MKLRCLLAATLVPVLGACGQAAAEEAAEEQVASGSIEVTAVDYAFEGLPERVAAGSTLSLVNESEIELHELVAIALPAEETRSVEDLVADPDALAAYFPSVAAVLIAPPLDGSIAVEGTGALTTPGRYAVICAIPTGAIPEDYLAAAAAAEGGPPDVAGGPPHFVAGMWGELVVEE